MGILRDKTVCKKNPHISKRKGGKKLPHRRFSLQVIKIGQLKPEVEKCIDSLNKIKTKCFFSMYSERIQKKGSKDKVRRPLVLSTYDNTRCVRYAGFFLIRAIAETVRRRITIDAYDGI